MPHYDHAVTLTDSAGNPINEGNPLPSTATVGSVTVTGITTKGSFTDRSGTIAVGGTSQQLAAANSSRNHLLIQNNGTIDLWINFGTAAVADQPSIKIPVGAVYTSDVTFVSTQAVNVIGASGGKWTAKEG